MMEESVKAAKVPNCSISSWRQVAAFCYFSVAPSERKSGANPNSQLNGSGDEEAGDSEEQGKELKLAHMAPGKGSLSLSCSLLDCNIFFYMNTIFIIS